MRFLVPIDFSDASAHMLRRVFELNRHFHARLEVLHLFDIPVLSGEDVEIHLKNFEAYRRSYEDEMWDFISSNRGSYRYEMEVYASAGGHYQGIVSFAEKRRPDLIIVGHKGSGSLRKWVFGSVSRYLLTHPPAPVLSIPEAMNTEGEWHAGRILYATDLSGMVAEGSLAFLRRFSDRLGAELIPLHVSVEDEIPAPSEGEIRAGVESSIGHRLIEIPAPGDDDIWGGIEGYVDAHAVDMLAVSPHRHGWLDRMMLGSETRRLAELSKIPILSLPGG